MELLHVKNVSKRYEGSDYDAVYDAELVIESGDSIYISGESGSGKSTLLLMMSGLLPPDEGSVLFNGKNIYEMKDDELSEWRGKNAGYIFQNVQFAQALTVRENIRLSAMFGNAPDINIDELLEMTGLQAESDKLPAQLSGGQKRRAMIACVLARKPAVLFADEPTNDLDEAWSEAVIKLISEYGKKEKTALVLVTHDSRKAQSCSSRFRMDSGKLRPE